MKFRLLNIFFALAIVCPSILSAQDVVDVDRSKYPDYSRELNPDYSLMQCNNVSKVAGRSGTAKQRPEYVNNAETLYFPPVFNQDGGSCGSASRICYMFSYELAAYRGVDGSNPQNYYPSHFVWLHTNSPGMQGKDDFVANVGVPSAATYGGQTYSSLFGYQEEKDDDFGWMQGYDKWFEAMHNRMLKPRNFPKTVKTEEGREAVKHWLWNHNGDESFKSGGICGIGVASGGVWEKIPSTNVNDSIGVTNKYYVYQWGKSVDHALTIVGYDDRIEFDLDGDGVFGEADADERGAWIIVNSWGGWCNDGFIYCPYAYGGTAFKETSSGEKVFNGDFWAPEVYHVRKDYRPLRTIKLEMEYSHRSEIALIAGVSDDLNATEPDITIPFVHFTYAGDGNNGKTSPAPEIPMLGRWADGKLHTEPMEFGYDLTDLSAGYDRNKPLKYFFIVETKSRAKGTGLIHKASIMDYEYDEEGLETPFAVGDGVEIKNYGEKTMISVVVHGGNYYEPQNISLVDNKLSWQAPLRSTNTVASYNIYCNGSLLCNVPADVYYYTLEELASTGAYGVSAVYTDAKESVMATVAVPVALSERNVGVNFFTSGFSIPDVFNLKYPQATIEYWIKPNVLEIYNQRFGPGWGSFIFHSGWGGNISAGWNNDVSGNYCTTSYNVLQVGVWSHVAVVVDKNKMTVYVNGVKKASVTSSEYSGIGGFGDLVFFDDAYHAQNAVYDEIRIWNTARTQEEINNFKNLEYSGHLLPEGLLADFKGDVIIGADGVKRLNDCVGGHHATFLNDNYTVVTEELPALTLSNEAPAVSINVPQELFAGIPTKITATYNAVVSKLEWTIDGTDIENLATVSPSVVFPAPGVYDVLVKGTANNGVEVVATCSLEVLETPEIDASFLMSTNRIPAGKRVTYLVNNPVPGYLYEWYMSGADKEFAKGGSVGAVYQNFGNYEVSLTVTALNGTQKINSDTITVTEVAPKAAFSVLPAVVLKGDTFSLVDETIYAPQEWAWLLESKAFNYIVNAKDTVLVLNETGVYDVTLTVANNQGSDKLKRERALVVCNADSKNGLNFSGGSSSVVATRVPFEDMQKTFTIEWWQNASKPTASCNGIGDSKETMLLTVNAGKGMNLYINGREVKTIDDYIIPNEWHHYAVTFNSGNVKFYRDGFLFYLISGVYSKLPMMETFKIGDATAPFNGSIDEFRVWETAFSVEKIRSYANAPITDVAAAEAGDKLLLYYDFNQNSGDVLDVTSNENHGVRVGFGPDGDAWGLSKGVFCINFNGTDEKNVASTYLSNYEKEFRYTNKCVNPSLSTRVFALKDWKMENAVVDGDITTGAHVDKAKNTCLTVTTGWDDFASTLSDHKLYQTIDLPAGFYSFEVEYDEAYEGDGGTSYMVVAAGTTLPVTGSLEESIAYRLMNSKGKGDNKLAFYLEEKTKLSIGLLINMSGNSCMVIQRFKLLQKDYTVIGGTMPEGSVPMPEDIDVVIDENCVATFYANDAMQIPEGITAYVADQNPVIEENGEGYIVLREITDGVIPAKTGAVICGEHSIYTFVYAEGGGTAVVNNLMSGYAGEEDYERVSMPNDGSSVYTLSVDDGNIEFNRKTRAFIVYKNNAYLKVPGVVTAVTKLRVCLGDVEDVLGVLYLQEMPDEQSEIYDLQGRRVTTMQKGVYIKNGKKVVN